MTGRKYLGEKDETEGRGRNINIPKRRKRRWDETKGRNERKERKDRRTEGQKRRKEGQKRGKESRGSLQGPFKE